MRPPARIALSMGLAAMAVSAFPPASAAENIFGAIGWETSREFGGFSEQPEGAVVDVDPAQLGPADDAAGFSMNPGGTTLIADVFDPPPPNDQGWLWGIEFASGKLYAVSFECDGCSFFAGPSRLIDVDAGTEIGPIQAGGVGVNVYDLATHPVTGVLYGISSVLDENDISAGCFRCLYTIDTSTAAATLIGEVGLGNGLAGGLAFLPDGTLVLTTVFPTGSSGSFQELLTLNPATAAIIAREDVKLEEQFFVNGNLVETVALQGLGADVSGRLVGTGDNGVTIVYERIFGVVLDPNGQPVTGTPEWVWRRLGDSGENISDIVFAPDAGPTDSDGDGVPDDVDVCPGGDDTLDGDGDGVPDSCDACPGGDDSLDGDSDGVPDSCDVCADGDDNTDTDGDGVPNACDDCAGADDNADFDGDGLPDACDACPADPDNDADSDGVCGDADVCEDSDDNADQDTDGTPDGCDVCEGGDDSSDGDEDGVPDFCDECPTGADDLDADEDGVPDACDICALGDDAADSDGDGVADACDPCPQDSTNDADGDGACGADDICQGGDDSVDTDADGTPDFCDVCPLDPGNDADGDGVCEVNDNCPIVSNADQFDQDGDGEGDACDDDIDGDGVPNGVDNCVLQPNANQADADNDGIGDVCDDSSDDLDLDGVPDSEDVCLDTPLGEAVDAGGCAISQLCPCEHPIGGDKWKNHGAYVRCVAHTSNDFRDQGLISDAEREAIVEAAAESQCGKKQKDK